jgi:ABC-type nickel/cobalt efflux system permease component RcnA
MGLVGGLVPSPSALLLLLGALALGKPWVGVGMVLAFGLGMAASLAFVGVIAREMLLRLERFAISRGRFTGTVRVVLAYGAAVGVCLVGTTIVVRTLLDRI